jgi:flagellar assembly protein FliH
MGAQRKVSGGEIEVLKYPACAGAMPLPAWDGWVEAEEAGAADPAHGRAKGVRASAASGAMDERLAEETRRSFEAGRERGREEGRQAEHEAQSAALAAEADRYKRQLAALAGKSIEERDQYLHAIEQEVVKLALAVAARILRREAQMDPLLLTGAVRVALGQLAASSEVRLRVPAAELELWTEAIALLPHLARKPVVEAGEIMRLGDCMIESEVGTVDLGVRSQLGEIERGFFDRGISSTASKAEANREGSVAARDGDAVEAEP